MTVRKAAEEAPECITPIRVAVARFGAPAVLTAAVATEVARLLAFLAERLEKALNLAALAEARIVSCTVLWRAADEDWRVACAAAERTPADVNPMIAAMPKTET